ncbi:MAG TPA: glycosyltransferase [Bacteroidales bacterium]|nr:glycosyltransferase [Bacteroidales bacterium]
MNIILTGLPLFAGRLCDELSSFDKKNKYYFYNTYYSRKDRFRFMLRLPFADRVVSLNGVSDRSGSLDWVLRFRKKLVMLWQGTDVMLAVERYKDNSILAKYINYATHYTDAAWLAEELSAIHIPAELLYFKSVVSNPHAEKFNEINAYSYIPKGRELFYGLDILLAVFKNLPDTKLYIYGTDGAGFEKTGNVFYKEWMPMVDYKREISNHAVYIRLSQHDGFSMSVLEALASGCEVIWNHPLKDCHYLQGNEKELTALICEIKKTIINRDQFRNKDSANRIRERFGKEKVLQAFIDKITR